MTHRQLKQALYAGTVFSILWVIIGGSMVLLLPNKVIQGPAVPQEQYLPVEIESVVVIPHTADGEEQTATADVVAQLRNPNPRAGVAEYKVEFVLFNRDGAVITRIPQTTYLLPGAVHYVAVLDVGIPPGQQLTSVKLTEVGNVMFKSLPENINPPKFSVSMRGSSDIQRGNGVFSEQKGIVTNQSAFDWHSVEVTAVGLAGTGDIIAVGKTFVGKLKVLEQREFTVYWRKPSQIVTRIVPIPSTNIFREANYENVVGDPSLLR